MRRCDVKLVLLRLIIWKHIFVADIKILADCTSN